MGEIAAVTVERRIKELELDDLITKAKVEAIEEEIATIEGGREELDKVF